MIQTKYGNLLDAKGVIVHGCNAQGVMGSGVAKQIKERWPGCYEAYREHLKRYKQLGIPLLGKVVFQPVPYGKADYFIANAITQEFYGREKGKVYVDYEAIRDAFEHINYVAPRLGITTINFPKIGAGLGGGDWSIISQIIDEELDDELEKILWIPVEKKK